MILRLDEDMRIIEDTLTSIAPCFSSFGFFPFLCVPSVLLIIGIPFWINPMTFCRSISHFARLICSRSSFVFDAFPPVTRFSFCALVGFAALTGVPGAAAATAPPVL